MQEKKMSAVTLPLVDSGARATETLHQAHVNLAGAVVSTDGKGFWLYDMSDLTAAVGRDGPSVTLKALKGRKLPVLSAAKARDLGLDFFHLDEERVRKVFHKPDEDLVITSVVDNFAGDRLVVALVRPAGNFTIVTKKWVCPIDGVRYPYSGTCPDHNVALDPDS